jgi:hypothetical protein
MPISIGGAPYPQYGIQSPYSFGNMYPQNGMFNQALGGYPPGYNSGYNPGYNSGMNGFFGGFPQQGYDPFSAGYFGNQGNYDPYYGNTGFFGGYPQQGFGYDPYGSSYYGGLYYPYGLPYTNDPYASNLLSIVGSVSPQYVDRVMQKFYDKNMRQYPGESTKQTWDLHLESNEKQALRSYAILNPGSPAATLVQIAEGSLGLNRRDENPYARWFGPYARSATTPQPIIV